MYETRTHLRELADIARRLLPYPLCSIITLLASIIENPINPHSSSNVDLISCFVRFLEMMQRKEGYDIDGFLTGCTMLEDIAKETIARAHDIQAASKPFNGELLQVGGRNEWTQKVLTTL